MTKRKKLNDFIEWCPQLPIPPLRSNQANGHKMPISHLKLQVLAAFLGILLGTLLVGLFVGFKPALFTGSIGFIVGTLAFRYFCRGDIYQHSEEANLKTTIERLSAEGVIDYTAGMARARIIGFWWSEKTRVEMLREFIKDFAEVKRHSGRTYAIDRQASGKFLAKLPIKDKDLSTLGISELHVFETLRTIGDIELDGKGEWHKTSYVF